MLRVKIVAAASGDNATDTGCVGVAASTVAKAKAEDAAHLSDLKISMATGGDGPSPTRILGLTSSTCRPSDTNARLLDTLQKSCERYPGPADRQPLRPEQGRGGGGGRLLPG